MTNEFRQYNHLEKTGHRACDGLLNGLVYVFPKIDGTNASVWAHRNTDAEIMDGANSIEVRAGSRKRVLSEGADNAGFRAWVMGDTIEAGRLRDFITLIPDLIIYGEWLVQHTIRYLPDAYRQFYVFDVYDRRTGKYLAYPEYAAALNAYGIIVVPPIVVLENPKGEDIEAAVGENRYLMPEGEIGEGVVCKNYDWQNKFGHQTWLKVVREGFHGHKMKKVQGSANDRETEIAEVFVTDALVRKNVAKAVVEVANELGVVLDETISNATLIAEKRGKIIPMVLGRTFFDVIDEEMLAIVKRFKMPTIDFKKLRTAVNDRVKALAPELFS